jgi:hypothetical protein
VCGGANTGGEGFGGDDEGSGVSTKVEEELQEREACNKRSLSDGVDFTSHDGEEEGGHEETAELEPLAADDIDREERDVVAWQETEGSDDDVTRGESKELTPDILTLSRITDLSKHDGLIQVDTVERNIDEEPAESRAEEDLKMRPCLHVMDEFLPGSLLRRNDTMSLATLVSISGLDAWGIIRLEILLLLVVVFLMIGCCECLIRFLGESELARLGEGQALVEDSESRDERETDEDTPDLVNVLRVSGTDIRLECSESDNGDKGTDERAPTLIGEDEAQHGSATVDVGTIGNNGGGHGIISTYTNTEDDTAYKDPYQDLVTGKVGWDGDCDNGGDDDEDEFLSIHGRSTKSVTEETETDLTNDTTDIGSGLDKILPTIGETSLGVVDGSEHGSDLIDNEQIIGIEEETNTSKHYELNLGPCKLPWLLVPLRLLFLLVVLPEMVEIGKHIGGTKQRIERESAC